MATEGLHAHKAPAAPVIDGAALVARLLYRDGLMLVIDKPAGLPVHAGPQSAVHGKGSNLEAHFDALRFGLPRPPALAHRLDRETSGCLVLGRHRKALAHLGLLFKHGKIDKTYWAVVRNGPDADSGEINLALGRRNAERGWWQKPDPDGLPSLTRFRVLGRGHDAQGASIAWLALEPVTGRTHQLRVHCAAMNYPIVGDAIYGDAARFGGEMLQLHAREIVIPISKNKPLVTITAPAPEHMRDRLMRCGWNGFDDAAYLPPPMPVHATS